MSSKLSDMPIVKKYLKPILIAIAALVVSGTGYVKAHYEVETTISSTDEKVIRLELKEELLEARINDLEAEMELLRTENIKLNATAATLKWMFRENKLKQ